MPSESPKHPKVAVCLAAFNGLIWLPEQLDSILAQEEVNVVVFISVDLSTDATHAWCLERAASDDRIVVLPYGARFGGAAANFFRMLRDVDFSGFDYLALADQDDVWLSVKLARAHEVLRLSGADAYSSNVTAFWPDGRKMEIVKSQKQTQWDFLFEAAGPGCTYVLRTGLVCKLQQLLVTRAAEFQQVYLHDWLVYAYVRASGHTWVIDDRSGMQYRQHAQNQVGVNSGWGAFAYRAAKVLGGWGLAQSALIARLAGLESDPFVLRWSGGGRAGVLWLGLHAGLCRRRGRDKILFALSCVAMAIVGGSIQ